jgi:drug/metabolite transporter (DMT)-like permease
MILGVFGVLLPQCLIFVGNRLSGPNIVSIMQPAAPVWTALFAVSLKLEKLSQEKVAGIVLAVLGALGECGGLKALRLGGPTP